MKYASLDLGTIEAVVNKLGGMDGVQRFLRGEVEIRESDRRWQEENGVVFFSLPATNGRTGEGWIEYLESKGFQVSDYAKSVLRSPDFKPNDGVIYKIAVLKGMLFQDNDRIISNIRAEADRRKFLKPNAEVACLIRDNFSDKEIEAMGLWWIVAMHEPIEDSDGDPLLLHARRSVGGRWLRAAYGKPGDRWVRESGFAFVLPQVSP